MFSFLKKLDSPIDIDASNMIFCIGYYIQSWRSKYKSLLTDTPSHKQLRNVVAEQMRAAILNGHYKPGEWLRQERLAQDLGVSQMPVREALKELAAEGLIEHVPYRGARVIVFSINDILDLYSHRAFLESRAASHCSGNHHVGRDCCS